MNLHLIHSIGFVRRRKDGLCVRYMLADKGGMQMCDVMCGRLEQELKQKQQKRLAG